ncbi:MAG: hypothetical protein KDA61_21395, partial [Planctomycetales bacterium]|nr:hypothetical protein [Planctomycetales bacterium]
MNERERFEELPRDVRFLIQRSLDEPLADAEFAELQKTLKASKVAREFYLRLTQLHADLFSHKQAADLVREVQFEYPSEPPTRVEGFRLRLAALRPWGRVCDAWRAIPPRAAAALLIAGLGLGGGVGIWAAAHVYGPRDFASVPWNWRVESDVVARIESTHNLVWQIWESPETLPARGLRAGEMLRIDEGLLQIAYRNGVSVILQGPAVYEVRSSNGGKLFSGRISTTIPTDNVNLLVETPAGKLQLGVGHFGLVAENSASSRRLTFYGFDGSVRGESNAQFENLFGVVSHLSSGDAVLFDDAGLATRLALPVADEFPRQMPQPLVEAYPDKPIYLGNLFDDSMTASLTQAMESDAYNAAAETIDLGVAAVRIGGLDVDVRLAEDGVLFNFLNVGGGAAKVSGLPGNDTHRAISVALPIRTTGRLLEHDLADGSLPKVEEGVGIDANKLLTFELREIRRAGKLEGREMRFVADRAGMNDREHPLRNSLESAHANLIAVVSTESEVLTAHLNGQPVDVVRHGDVNAIDVDEATATRGLRYDGRFVRFDVPLPPHARFLSLVAVQLESEHHDHTVFSGARLEISPAAASVDSEAVDSEAVDSEVVDLEAVDLEAVDS